MKKIVYIPDRNIEMLNEEIELDNDGLVHFDEETGWNKKQINEHYIFNAF